MHFVLLLRFTPRAAVAHILSCLVLFTDPLYPPFSRQIPKQVCSGFLLCLELLSSDPSTMFQLSKIPCRTFDLTDQKWFRSSYNILQHLKGCIFHEKSCNTCPHVLRAIVPNTINMHSLKMLSSFPELDLFWNQFACLFKMHKTLEFKNLQWKYTENSLGKDKGI